MKEYEDYDTINRVAKSLSDKLMYIIDNWCHGIGVRKETGKGFYIIIKVWPGTKKEAEEFVKDQGINVPYKIEECEMIKAL